MEREAITHPRLGSFSATAVYHCFLTFFPSLFSQDTIIALEALSKFAKATFTKDLNLQFEVSLSSGTTLSHSITDTNRNKVHEIEVG